MNITTRYFDEASSEHTVEVATVVRSFLESNPNVDYVVVATTEGATGAYFAKEFSDKQVIVVTHQVGFVGPNEIELLDENRRKIENEGAKILTTTHAFAGVDRGIRKGLGTWTTSEIIAVVYRTFGEGTKVCAEISMMAADAGLVPVDKDLVCVAGTGRGADTAWVIRPTNTNAFTELKMKACICKPIGF
ncbi:MAG: pyruvate kinase alpha/beta domain-containing protein [Candidatus Thorarchaeota archaeon]|jgi:hypothetical protein